MALFLNGILNGADPWIGWPIYLWGLILWWIILIPAAWFILKKVKWDPYNRFHGLHFAKKNDSAACLITDDTGDTHMVAEHIAKCIFSYGDDEYEIEIPDLPLGIIKKGGIIAAILGAILIGTGSPILGIVLFLLGIIAYFIERAVPWVYKKAFFYPTKYLKNLDWQQALLYKIGGINYDCKIAQLLQGGEWDAYPIVNAGGIDIEWAFDSNHWCERNSPQHKAIVRSAREYNKDHQDDQVHTYTKYQRYLSEKLIECPEEIKKDYLVPWERIDLGFPFDLRNVDTGGKLRQMAKNKENKTKAEGNKYTMLLIVAGIVLFFLVYGSRFAFKLFAAAPK